MYELTAHGFLLDLSNVDFLTSPAIADVTLVFRYTDKSKEEGIKETCLHYLGAIGIREDRITYSIVEK